MSDVNTITTAIASKSSELTSIYLNPKVLVFGVLFIIAAVVIIFFLKNIILNSIVGIAGLLICNFVLGYKLPFTATIIVSAIFGAAGLGAMLILKFLGIV